MLLCAINCPLFKKGTLKEDCVVHSENIYQASPKLINTVLSVPFNNSLAERLILFCSSFNEK